jgi:hypothetical protein
LQMVFDGKLCGQRGPKVLFPVPVRSERNLMSNLIKTLPWLVAGAALYHLGLTMLEQRDARTQALAAKKNAEVTAKKRRLYRLAVACQRGMLNN